MKLYLAYGANTNHRSMAGRCPDAKYICNMTLHHHRLVFRGVADVVAVRGARAVCALWAISAKDEEALDRFEGYPHLYVKKYVNMLFRGRKHRVMFYVMRDRKYEAVPSDIYEACLREGYTECGMPLAQIDNAIERAKEYAATHRPLVLVEPKGTVIPSWPPHNQFKAEWPRERDEVARDEIDAADEFMMNWYQDHYGTEKE